MTDNTAHDLTSVISPYLDLHMMFPLLEYIDSLISGSAISYQSSDVAKARLSLLRPTHMVDYAMDIYRELHGEDSPIPAEMEEQKAAVLKQLEDWKNDDGCKAFEELCQDDAQRLSLVKKGLWNVAGITSSSNNSVNKDVIETYRKLAKFNFDCGDYQTSEKMLTNVISLYAMPPLPKEEDENDIVVDDDRVSKSDKVASQKTGNPNVYYLTSINTDLLQILWGKLSCEILLENWDEASTALKAVRLSIEQLVYTNQMTALEALTQRTWLLHWSLFVFWNNSSKGLESMVELFFSEKYLQAITTNAPHLLRYLTAAVLLTKRRVAKSTSKDGRSSGNEARKLLKDLVQGNGSQSHAPGGMMNGSRHGSVSRASHLETQSNAYATINKLPMVPGSSRRSLFNGSLGFTDGGHHDPRSGEIIPTPERDYATLEKSIRSPPGPVVPGIHSTPIHQQQGSLPRRYSNDFNGPSRVISPSSRSNGRSNLIINQNGEPELVADLL